MRKRNPQVNAVVSPQIMDELVRRAQAIGATKSEYASLIIRQWFAQGGPAVSELERRLSTKDDSALESEAIRRT